MRLKDLNVKKGFIEIKTATTGLNIMIPLRQQITAVLKKRNGAWPQTFSKQKFNLSIKEICKIVVIQLARDRIAGGGNYKKP